MGSWIALQVVDVLKDNMGLPDWVFPFAVVLLILGLPVVLATAIIQERLPGQGGEDDRRRSARPGRSARLPEPGEYASSGSGYVRPAPKREPAAAVAAPAEAASDETPHRRLFTWRNALGGGALAFLFLTVVTSGFMFMRANGIGPAGTLVARGLIDERSPILVAEFEASAADAELARAMTEAFRIDFSQTQVVRLMEPARIAEALRRMELDPTTALTPEVARRLARREGIPAVIAGSFSRLPGGYVMTGRIEDAEGAVLVSHRETAGDSTEVLPAIDALSKKLRERLGESFSSLRADEPLERVTTSSLRALELYSEAVRTIEYAGNEESGIRLLEEALDIDPEFASAWRKLGVGIQNLHGATARSAEAVTRAFELRDRLTPRERYLAEASYYSSVAFDNQRAIAAYDRMLDLDPNDPWALNNVAILYGREGDHERSLRLTERTVELDTSATSLGNLALEYLRARRVDEADSVIALLQTKFPADHRARWLTILAEAHREDFAEAEKAARDALAETDGVGQVRVLWGLHGVLKTTGRLREADEAAARAARLSADLGVPSAAYAVLWPRFWTAVVVHRDPGAARREIERVRDQAPLESLEPLDRPYLGLAGLYAALGDRAETEALLAAFKRAVPDAPTGRYEDDEVWFAADLALSEGRWDDAIAGYEEWRRLEPGCANCIDYPLAIAHDSAGRLEVALEHYLEEIDRPGESRLRQRATTLGPTLERIAQIHDELGRLEEAAAYYARFADLWAEADPELQPRVTAARARAEEIVRARG
ncbi:MAG TPA: tetratricopeptide repeat protein [Gemmatimonadota bacterium]|nr:tetratricopeptide repeat protein [Gemmatimonadota bacterium]